MNAGLIKPCLILVFISSSLSGFAQNLCKNKEYYISAVGFWNVENLYDTINDNKKKDDEFTPEGLKRWTGDKYRTKIGNLATVISEIATGITADGLALLGLCEVENKSVLHDLVNHPKLKKRNYQFVHIEGPDIRGIDPAFVYNPAYFNLKKALAYPVKLAVDSTYKTRDILVVSGLFLDEAVAVLVNHWPSRRGGEMLSRANRNAAAKLVRYIADSVVRENPVTRLIIMGDLNDDPVNESVRKYIGTYANVKQANDSLFFNPMEALGRKGIGTLAWQDCWHLFDQILLSSNWISGNFETWQYYQVRIFNKEYLKSDFGNFKGYPFRTYSGGVYTGGYSDHFPSYILLAKEKQEH